MYKLVGKNGKSYFSEEKGLYGGHRKLKIYGKLDCPSALRYIKAGYYVQHRVFFADEETALSAGYRPCSVCMKKHYELWKEGKLMSYALKVSPVLDEKYICSVQLADDNIKYFSTEKLKDSPIPERLKSGIEYSKMDIEGDYCIIILSDEKSQWGYTVVWNYVQDKLVHLTNTPYVVYSIMFDSQIVNMYLVQYWGHPADLWYSITPVQTIDSDYEPEMIPLTISVDESLKDITSCKICIDNGKLVFRAGVQEECIKIASQN